MSDGSPSPAWSISKWTIADGVETGMPLVVLDALVLTASNLLMLASVMQPMAKEYMMEGPMAVFSPLIFWPLDNAHPRSLSAFCFVSDSTRST